MCAAMPGLAMGESDGSCTCLAGVLLHIWWLFLVGFTIVFAGFACYTPLPLIC